MSDHYAHGEKTRREGGHGGRGGGRESSGGYVSNRLRYNNQPVASSKPSMGKEDSHYKFLETFKTVQCKQSGPHDRRACKFWHSKLDRRRNPFAHAYSAVDCSHQSESSDCLDGDECKFSHNTLEKMYHPNVFKMSMCQKILSGSECSRGALCAFAHSPEEQRQPALSPQAPSEFANASLLKKLVHLIQTAGEKGVLDSELPQRFQDTFHISIEEATDSGRTKVKDILADHDNIQILARKGEQPKYVYAVRPLAKKFPPSHPAEYRTAPTTNGDTEPPSLSEIQSRLVQIIKSCGENGVLGSDLPKKYMEIYHQKVEALDDSGAKVRLKDILISHADIRYEMYKQLQPRFFFSEGCNKDYQPPAKPEPEGERETSQVQVQPQQQVQQQDAAPAPSAPTNNATTQLRSVLLGGAPGLSLPASSFGLSSDNNASSGVNAAAAGSAPSAHAPHNAMGLPNPAKGVPSRSPAHVNLTTTTPSHGVFPTTSMGAASASQSAASTAPLIYPTLSSSTTTVPQTVIAPATSVNPSNSLRTDFRSFPTTTSFVEESSSNSSSGGGGIGGHDALVPDAMTRVLLERVHELNQIYMYLHLIDNNLSHVVNKDEHHLEAVRHLWTVKLAIKERLDQLGFRSNTLPTPLTSSAMGIPVATASAVIAPVRAVSSVPAAVPPTPLKPVCAMPDCNLEGIYVCTGCRQTYYCGVLHQRQHWAQQHCGECNR